MRHNSTHHHPPEHYRRRCGDLHARQLLGWPRPEQQSQPATRTAVSILPGGQAAFSGASAPTGLSAEEKVAYERLSFVYAKGIGYGFQMGLRPQTLYGIADSPVGLAAYFLDHDARSYELIARVFQGQSEGLTRDDILDNVTITWLTNTGVSGGRLYWQNWGKSFFDVKGVAATVPVAVSVFPDEPYPPPAVGRNGHIPISFTTRGTTKAGTLPPGNSRNFFQKTFAWASDRCADSGREAGSVMFRRGWPITFQRRDRLRGERSSRESDPPRERFLAPCCCWIRAPSCKRLPISTYRLGSAAKVLRARSLCTQ
jgi:hypothetical protein